MSKLNILELNKNLKTYAANVFEKAARTNEEIKKRTQEIQQLEFRLLERIDARDNTSLSGEKEAVEAPVAHIGQDVSRSDSAAQPAPQPLKKEQAEATAVAADMQKEAQRKTDAPAAQAQEKIELQETPSEMEQMINTKQRQSVAEDTIETEQEKITEVKKPKKSPAKKQSPKTGSTANINVYIPDLSAFKPRIRVVRSAKDEELAQKKREEKQKRIKTQSRPGREERRPRTQSQAGVSRGTGSRERYRTFDKDEASQDVKRSSSKAKSSERTTSHTPAQGKRRHTTYESKKRLTQEEIVAKRRRAVIKERAILADEELERRSHRGRKKEKQRDQFVLESTKIESAVITGDVVSIKTLASKIGKPAADILKKLMLLGTMCTINSEIDFDTASLIAGEFGVNLEQKIEQTAEAVLQAEDRQDEEKDTIIRPPVVTVMGHVDHGKTSLLDAIRKTKVQEGEAGGITQHIGAYTVTIGQRQITFLDTPGHEAFTAMRARGAQSTDIAVLVVAADDGVMPQTKEAINHAKLAKVPILVAINKIDKPGADIGRVKQQLTEDGLVAEEWGGDTIMVPVSAVTGEGISSLLEMILLLADVCELRANPNRLAKGTIVEASLDKGRGPVATVLVQNGTLKLHDMVVAGMSYGRVRAMFDDTGNSVEEAGPSMPVEVIGFSDVPAAGDTIYAVEENKLSKRVVEERKDRMKEEQLKKFSRVSLDDLYTRIAEGQVKSLNIIVKADVRGSVEAVSQSLEKISNEEVRVSIVHGGVGAINESDVMLASVSDAIIIGFNVRPDAAAAAAAEKENVDIRLYRIIYNAIDDVTKAIHGMLKPEFVENVIGHAEVRQIFKISSVGVIAGCYVQDGKISRGAQIRLLRDNIVVHEGTLSSLKRFKDDVREVATGYECGLSIENFNDLKEGDVIEAFEIVEVKK